MREMRMKNRKIEEKEAMDILLRGEYGILSTISEDGYPYGVPISYAVDGNKIYIHGTNSEGEKAENIKNNSKVCFTVVGNTKVVPEKFTTKYESVIVYGTAVLAESPVKGLEKIIDKYSSDYKEKGQEYIKGAASKVSVYEITIEKITGKANR